MDTPTSPLNSSPLSVSQPREITTTTPQEPQLSPPKRSKCATRRMRALKNTSRDLWKSSPDLLALIQRSLDSIPRAVSLASRQKFPCPALPNDQTYTSIENGSFKAVSTITCSRSVRVCIDDCVTAVSVALDEYSPRCQIMGENVVPTRFVFWVDASKRMFKGGSAIGIAVVRKFACDSDDWISQGYIVKQRMSTPSAEAFAISQALSTASCIPDDLLKPNTTIVIYSDNRPSVKRIAKFDTMSRDDHFGIFETIRRKAEELNQRGSGVEFRWVPSHQHVPGNVLADKVARLASKKCREMKLAPKTRQKFKLAPKRCKAHRLR